MTPTNPLYLLHAYAEPLDTVRATIEACKAAQGPGTAVMLIHDGPPGGAARERIADTVLFRRQNAKQGSAAPGYWTHEMLRVFLLTKRPLLVKFDPDTVWRSRLTLPDVPRQDPKAIYGRVVRRVKPYAYVHGGCLVVPAEAASILVESELLLKFEDNGMPRSQDQMLGGVCPTLGIRCFDLPGIEQTSSQAAGEASVLHP